MVCKDLLEKKDKYVFSFDSKKENLNDRQKNILYRIYKDKQKNGILLFNDPHPGLRTDIFFNDSNLYKLMVKKTDYFSHITSNQLIYKKIYKPDSTLFYEGWRMTLNDDFSYKNIQCSRAANMFGVSSLLVSKDGYLIISRQGRKNDSGVSELIPSATGSIDIEDININRYLLDNNEKLYYLNDLITNAGKREIEEETYVSINNIDRIDVIGFMRMMFLGGHPEFMTLAHAKLTKKEIIEGFIKNNSKDSNSKGLLVNATGDELDEIITSIKLEDIFEKTPDELIEEKLPNQPISIQLYMILTLLNKHHKNNLLN